MTSKESYGLEARMEHLEKWFDDMLRLMNQIVSEMMLQSLQSCPLTGESTEDAQVLSNTPTRHANTKPLATMDEKGSIWFMRTDYICFPYVIFSSASFFHIHTNLQINSFVKIHYTPISHDLLSNHFNCMIN